MELTDLVLLVLFYTGAFTMPLVAARIHIPAAVAEIIFGLILGAIGVTHGSTAIDFLAELGFVYLMFLVGMEIDFNHIEREGKKTIAIAFFTATLILALSHFIALRINMPLFMGLVIGAMSVSIMLVALIESYSSKTRWGQTLLLVGSIGEILTLLTLTTYHLIHTNGLGWELTKSGLRVIVLFVVAFFILALMRLAAWWFPHSFQRWVKTEDPSELGVRFGFVLMIGMTALSVWMGLDAIVGAFLSGLLLAFLFRQAGVLQVKLAALGQGFFVPIFFINIGITFDWSLLNNISTILSATLLLGTASLAAKFIPSLLLIAAGLPFRTVLGGAFLLATPLTLLIAIAAIGQDIELISAETGGAVILFAIIAGVVFPTLFKLCISGLEQPLAIGKHGSTHFD